jgi:polyisoprenyl-teichoic acid--peptidoglycan teichoic acid transferase
VSTAADAQQGPPRLGRRMLLRFALAGLIIVVLSAATVASAVLLEVDEAVQIFKRSTTPIDPAVKELLAGVKPGKPQTILVIGDDRRKKEALKKHPPPTRSDTMILVRLDPSKGATALMSLPRDLLVDIPGHGRDKLNAAFALGEDQLTLRTVRDLLGIPIHHYVRVTFWGFRGAVDRLGCVYADVDRRYFNDNHPPAGGGPPYAVIDVGAGYQRLCGERALDYVRYRHGDNDLVRAARQQSFLGEAKNQIGLSSVFGDRKALLKIFGESVRTDISSNAAILSLLKLVAKSAAKPVQEVQFPARDVGDDSGNLEISQAALDRTVAAFLAAKAVRAPRASPTRSSRATARRRRKASRRARRASLPRGLILNRRAGENVAAGLQVKLSRLPVYYPAAMSLTGNYRVDDSRAYDIVERNGRRHRTYRIVAYEGSIGQYYGIQGTAWRSPPILDDPTRKIRTRGRTYELFYDGNRLRMVAWRTPRGSYWVSNTLMRSLNSKQMLAIARSLRRVGA